MHVRQQQVLRQLARQPIRSLNFCYFILHRAGLRAYVIVVFLHSRRTEISVYLTSRELTVNTVKQETSLRTKKESKEVAPARSR